jgi:DNA-binding protein HU-beta
MKRTTTKDRDRTLRVVSGLTGGLTALAVAATGLATAFAAQTTQRKDALKLAAEDAAGAGLAAEPGETSTVTEDAEEPENPEGTTTTSVKAKTTTKKTGARTTTKRRTTSAAARRTTTAAKKATTTSKPRTTTTSKPRTTTTTAKPKPKPSSTTKTSSS